ncbi:RHS repeat-associated core domain-containing protein [Flectobacillus sp. DC10W]|uniref:RHS repeat-associated core domain-containing protein n=1 Tax=Flectobacillus longus TaxID=2984207 RepID=A0ABT6YRW3_9BACT|nr:RHS repeat-associated core domain-containing protein [Flectobacillus longus]MDI9866330.1 RHS repeat-associated core domain-containing protein [Flectobacillus longus]
MDYTNYDPWCIEPNGKGLNNPVENRFKYQSKESLSLFSLGGINDFGARYYDKTIGRWWGVDPLAEKMPNVNLYCLSFNNPINFLDPDGNKPIPMKQILYSLRAVSHLSTFETAWQNSKHGTEVVSEWAFTITMSKDKKYYYGRNLHTDGKNGSVSQDLNIPNDNTLVGIAHTHPYSKSEGAELGVGFSAADISNMRDKASEGGYFSIVEAGTKRYAIVISDPEKAIEFFKQYSKEMIAFIHKSELYDEKNASLSFAEKIVKAILKVVGNSSESGVTVFVTTDKNKKIYKPLE